MILPSCCARFLHANDVRPMLVPLMVKTEGALASSSGPLWLYTPNLSGQYIRSNDSHGPLGMALVQAATVLRPHKGLLDAHVGGVKLHYLLVNEAWEASRERRMRGLHPCPGNIMCLQCKFMESI